MPDIIYNLDPEIIIGQDTVSRAGGAAAAFGGRALVITEQVLYENKAIERLKLILEDAGVETIIFDEVPAQATADVALNAADLARGARCNAVIGLGGVKTQTTARLAAIMAGSRLDVFDILDGRLKEGAYLPVISIPTTGRDPFLFASYSVAVDPRDRSVKIVKCPKGLCAAAIIDPGLSETLSGKFASTTAFDGFCISVEAYCSTRSNFFSDAMLEQAICLYSRMIASYTENRTFDLISGSVNAGFLMAIGTSLSAPGIGTALSYALNGKFPVAKSWCSTVLLPYVLEKLVTARPEKIAKVAGFMGEPVEGASIADAANMAVDAIRRHMGTLQTPARLKDFNLSLDRLVQAAETARSLEFIAFSPWTVAAEDAYDLLKQAF
jgi:alcohol dehydrogenase